MKRTLKPGETVAIGNGFRVQQRETYYVMVDEAGHEYATGGGNGFYTHDDGAQTPEQIQAALEADAAIVLEEAKIDRQYAIRAMLDTPTYSFRSGFVFNSKTGEYIEAARPPKTGRR